MKKLYLIILIFGMLATAASAQNIVVSGKIVSESDNLPVPGVTILVEGTSIGTTTDNNGYYSLSAPKDGVLVFSFIGMQTQKVPVNGKKVIDVKMYDQDVPLGEVIVVGYSSTSEKLVTGSLDIVGEAEIKNIPVRTIDGVLEGQAAGLSISQSSGTPGSQSSIKLRGGSSIMGTNMPLIVIDGIPAITGEYGQVGFSGQEMNAMSDINPNDIETVTVLKDAAAASMYGARASNGVILITTKKGSAGRTSVNLNFNYGWQVLPEKQWLPLMNAQQWNEYKGTSVDSINTNWMSEILQKAPTSNTELSVSSGNDKFSLFLSGSYYNQAGIVTYAGYKRYNTRLNVDYKILPNLKIGAGVTIIYSKTDRVEGDQTLNGPLPNAMSIPAIYPVYNPDGTYNEDGPYANPVAIANESTNEAFTNRTNGNVYLEYKFLNGFTFTSQFGGDNYNLREHSYDPVTTRQGARYEGLGIEGTTYVSNITTNQILQYIKSIHEKHNFDALLGYSYEKYANRNTYIEAINFPNDDFQYIASAGTIRYASASALDRVMNSFFGQFNYNFKYKYIASFSARYDGSSKFGANNLYGFFPAGSVAWRIGQEPFLKNLDIFDELKLRVSYGVTGNDAIGDFASLALYGGGWNYGGEAGITPIQLPNPDLTWETTNSLDVGFDMAFAKNLVNITFDYYYNVSNDLLLERPIPTSSGFAVISSNIGSLQNKGIELTVGTSTNSSKSLVWKTSLNFSANRNEILSLYDDQPIDDMGRGGNSVQVGEPIGIFFGLNCLGVDPTTGNLVYEDLNGDGIITPDDRMKIGDPNPDWIGGLTNSFTYKNFDLSFFLQWVYGNDVFNATLIYLESVAGEDNQTTRVVDRWKQPGDITQIPRVGDTYKSSRFIEDGSFLRIKNLTLGYTLNSKISKKVGMKSARFYGTIYNLYTFTGYYGMDPEVNYYGGSSNIIMGTDFFTYPQSLSYIFGFNITF